MKRNLLLAALLAAPLYLRQRQVERRQRLWRTSLEAGLRREFGALVQDLVQARKEEGRQLDSFAKSVRRFTEEVNRELSRAGRP